MGYDGRRQAAVSAPKAPPADDDHPRILTAQLVDAVSGEPRNQFAPGDTVVVRLHVRNSRRPARLAVAVGVMRSEGTLCFAHSTQFEQLVFDHRECVVTLTLKHLRLLIGEY